MNFAKGVSKWVTLSVLAIWSLIAIVAIPQFVDFGQIIEAVGGKYTFVNWKTSPENKTILFWTSYFSQSLRKLLQDNFRNCDYQCIFTEDKSSVETADAVVFHIRNTNPKNLPRVRHPWQLYIFFLMESPHHSGSALSHLPEDFFNISMSYRAESEIRCPYSWFERNNQTSDISSGSLWDEAQRLVSQKNHSVLQMVSNCHTPSKREVYVKELAKHVDVTVLGGCGKRCNQQCVNKAIDSHYFYLSFENSVCRDYVTEKFFDRVKRYLVPVVLKGAIYENIVPNGSFIAADSFDSPKHLAKYLLAVRSNQTEYLKFFEWTKEYNVEFSYSKIACDLCKYLHERNSSEVRIENVQHWWFDEGRCEPGFAENLVNKKNIGSTPASLTTRFAENSVSMNNIGSTPASLTTTSPCNKTVGSKQSTTPRT